MWAEKWTIMQETSDFSTAQTPQGESIVKSETPLLIILSIACKYEVHGKLFSPLFEKQSPWTKTSSGGG